MEDANPVLCARCDVALKLSTDPNSDLMVSCPVCGESDSLDNALKESGEYFAHKFIRAALRGAASAQLDPLTFKHGPEAYYRFIRRQVDDDAELRPLSPLARRRAFPDAVPHHSIRKSLG